MIRTLARYLRPVAGRLSPRGAAQFGANLVHGCGYIGFGPVIVVFDLPTRFRKIDPPVVQFEWGTPAVPTLEDVNAAIRAHEAEVARHLRGHA